MVTFLSNKLNQRKLLMYVTLFAAMLFAVYPLFMGRETPVSVVLPAAQSPTLGLDKPAMPSGHTQQAVRDPFQKPKEIMPIEPTKHEYKQPKTTPILPQFQLKGVAVSNGVAAAILESGADSRSYRIGEFAGPYQVRSIGVDAVVLEGPGGAHILRMRR